jgi:hypothetical protein
MGAVDHARQAVGLNLDRHHHIQAQNGEVVEVIPIERLGVEVGMHTTQTLQATDALADTFKRWDLKAFRITHHDRFDSAMAADQEPNLAFDFTRKFGEVARQLLGDDAFRRETTAIQMFKAAKLARL